MPGTKDRSAPRRAREPGTPPRSVTALAAVALATVTGAALLLLPPGPDVLPAAPTRPSSAGEGVTEAVTEAVTTAPAPPGERPAAVRTARPPGFVTFVDAVRDPLPGTPGGPRRDHDHWFSVGHLTAGPDGCTPEWEGGRAGGVPVAARLGRLRTAGGAGLVFGGPAGRELAAACGDQERLLRAYRRVIGAFGTGYIDFEVRGPAGGRAVLRRAGAITALQREAAAQGRSLTVSFTLPVAGTGLSGDAQEMLRATRESGADITAVNLLVPIRSGAAGRARLRPVAAALHAARPQIARSLGETSTGRTHRIALTPVLAAAGDLTLDDARRLVAFAARNGVAWLSVRGARPAAGVVRLLTGVSRPTERRSAAHSPFQRRGGHRVRADPTIPADGPE
ncbi:hypothetical protein GCM10017673_07780 [Streptosporangium violaceochromogenes]|nr:hypothetical protein GCM10017673_07780 [Streptosporangium violaceochromogenes]